MPLAVSITDVLLVVGLGAAGFVVVVLVCTAVLALLQFILPATDAGAEEVERAQADAPAGGTVAPAQVDTEGDA